MAAKAKPGNDIYQLRAVPRAISPLVWRGSIDACQVPLRDLHLPGLEAVLALDLEVTCPLCITGKRTAHPEDCGECQFGSVPFDPNVNGRSRRISSSCSLRAGLRRSLRLTIPTRCVTD
jgi:hypothetical protein